MLSNADIVREASRVVWTEGQLDRVSEFYSDDFTADYAFTDWGAGIQGVRALAANFESDFLTTVKRSSS